MAQKYLTLLSELSNLCSRISSPVSSLCLYSLYISLSVPLLVFLSFNVPLFVFLATFLCPALHLFLFLSFACLFPAAPLLSFHPRLFHLLDSFTRSSFPGKVSFLSFGSRCLVFLFRVVSLAFLSLLGKCLISLTLLSLFLSFSVCSSLGQHISLPLAATCSGFQLQCAHCGRRAPFSPWLDIPRGKDIAAALCSPDLLVLSVRVSVVLSFAGTYWVRLTVVHLSVCHASMPMRAPLSDAFLSLGDSVVFAACMYFFLLHICAWHVAALMGSLPLAIVTVLLYTQPRVFSLNLLLRAVSFPSHA